MKVYELTLRLNEGDLEYLLQTEYDRKLTKAAVAAEGAGIIRDYGTVVSFTRIDKVLA